MLVEFMQYCYIKSSNRNILGCFFVLNTVFCALVKLHKNKKSTTFFKKTVKIITNVNHLYNIM